MSPLLFILIACSSSANDAELQRALTENAARGAEDFARATADAGFPWEDFEETSVVVSASGEEAASVTVKMDRDADGRPRLSVTDPDGTFERIFSMNASAASY